MKNVKNFHSYLFTGADQATRLKEIAALSLSLGTKYNPNSPDFFEISPAKSTIGIDQIRQLKQRIFQKPQTGPFNLVLIKNADTLTVEAQNSLLKLIEEPPDQAVIIMEANQKTSFLPTVISRVAVRNFKKQAMPPDHGLTNAPTYTLSQMLEVKDVNVWIDQQISANYQNILKNPKANKNLTVIIEKLATAKKMIGANVNQKFLLADLFFSKNP